MKSSRIQLREDFIFLANIPAGGTRAQRATKVDAGETRMPFDYM